ncbi:MAG: homocysteine S-methyltransferase family protein, partial [Clostridia bacterium]|nr:homocysteine S-methyltransferase family protein [Clostridia bacterium]
MNILEYMKDHVLWLDGGMGTLLQAEGLMPGERPERWNLTHADRVVGIHRRYYEAGSHVVNTNTFGANILKFSEEELEAVIAAAIENARRAAREAVCDHPTFVALDIGPTGRMLKPYGDLDFEDAVGIFAKTVRLGAKHGADLIFIETMNDSYETKAALLAAKEEAPHLPVFVSNAYGEDGKLMTGATPSAMVALLEGMGADAIGVNCSLGPKALMGVVEEYLRHASVPVLVKPNAGLPRAVDGQTVFDVFPEEFSEDLYEMIRKGVRIAGGCCGTTPDYIAATVKKSAGLSPVAVSEKHRAVISSYTHAVVFGEEPILIGERINPTGKKRFKEALRERDMDYILREAIAQEEKGVHVLDVNVGLPEIDEPAMLRAAITEIQAVSALPLQIDTSDPVAMEAALRRYNGKALINSVSGKRESMDAVFPLAKKYGGMMVALTLDESGIPASAEDRVAIARRILSEGARYGFTEKDFLFDPLALTVSADRNAPKETLRAVRMLGDMGCHTSLGVSNVSFGLPARDVINGSFFTLALGNGLSAAIMNPYSVEMMKAYYAFRVLHGLDENCADFIARADSLLTVSATQSAISSVTEREGGSELQRAITQGRRERACELTRSLILEVPPLEVVEREIIPALNTVGVGFEKGTVYLPGLLMSAEAASSAFEVIREALPAEKGSVRARVVLATVKGDIHDIGKNIVKLLLENYGFAVTDLGRDVPPEVIVDEAIRLQAPIVGLSALMTTTVPAMEETVRLLRERAPFCRVMVGGAV